VDLAMADNEQAFAGIYGNNTTPPAAIVNETQVGVVTFKWVRNPGLWTGGNVSSSQIRQALTGAGVVQSVFSGVSSDTHFVYVSGRNAGSGTRANGFGDTQFGIFNSPNQIELSAGAMVKDTDPNGVLEFIGNIGFTSGGDLSKTMGGASTTSSTDQVQTGTGFSVIAYLGFNDAATALGLTPPAVELTYNGVLYSPSGIENGQYTFWGYEYILEANGSAAPVPAIFTALSGSTGINSVLFPVAVSPNGIQLSAMLTTRSGPTGDPTHN
jgi:hypothetical protein